MKKNIKNIGKNIETNIDLDYILLYNTLIN